jgi:hypothetical protein
VLRAVILLLNVVVVLAWGATASSSAVDPKPTDTGAIHARH